MRSPALRIAPLLTAFAVLATACGQSQEPAEGPTKAADAPSSSGQDLPALVEAHLTGLGHMERFEYAKAVAAFRQVLSMAPESDPARINLAIALLNDSGVRTEEEKSESHTLGPTRSNFDEALDLLGAVIARDPENLHATYCRGLILQYLGELNRAHADFKRVLQLDPTDAQTWLRFGMTLADPKRPQYPAGLDQVDDLIEIYQKAVTFNPYLTTAWFKLQEAHNMAAARARGQRDPEEAKRLTAESESLRQLWRELDPNQNPSAPGEVSENFYGEMGQYASVLNVIPSHRDDPAPSLRMPKFDEPKPIVVELPEGDRWAARSDFEEDHALLGRIRDRFGAPVVHLDANRDGQLDLYLPAAIKTANGQLRDALLLNRGGGRFEDASADFGLPQDRPSVGVAVGDFDADGYLDLFLTGIGDNRLLRNQGGESFEDVTESLGLVEPKALSLGACWLDLDQDGDLDLYVINYTSLEHAEQAFQDDTIPPGLPNFVFRNDGKPAPQSSPESTWAPRAVDFQQTATQGLSIAWGRFEAPDEEALQGGSAPHTGLAWLDLDGDRDLDLVLVADGETPTAVLNDRLGRFRAFPLPELDPKGKVNGLLVLDLDRDGRSDLVLVRPDRPLLAWRNQTGSEAVASPESEEPAEPTIRFEPWPIDASGWRSAQVADLDLDGWSDLVGLADLPDWARNDGQRLKNLPLALEPSSTTQALGIGLADLLGKGLPDLVIIPDGEPPRIAKNQGNGHHWLGLAFSGRWKFGKGPDGGPMRTNPQGFGTLVELQGSGLDVPFRYTSLESGLGQSVGPVVLGLGSARQAMLIRLTWPDGVMQSELNVDADQVLNLTEFNRKTGSCPVLFSFDGDRFVCIGDILGGGGLGYLIAPGVRGEPDRDEAIAIASGQLREVDGTYRLAIAEPMDELAYLDHLELEVIDRPPGISVGLDERFAPAGNRPTGKVLAWRETIAPQKATDLEGRDVTEILRDWDRQTADTFKKLPHWNGYAEEHGIILDFGDQLAQYGPEDRLVLALAGWVEYPYSQTNYAASTAGVSMQPPVLERLDDDGEWVVIEPDPGYPAGLPRMTTVELTGKLGGPRCVLRLRTNMECYYDQAFVAVLESDAGLRRQTLPVQSADLRYRGYLREISPDGRPPRLYDFDSIDPAPLARLAGRLTRFGDVTDLLTADDDQFCLIGPGDAVMLEFDASTLPELSEGWTRSFVLRAIGYCKDADPFTAASDQIGPLPWKGMSTYPFGPEGRRPSDPDYEAYLRDYQTREVGP